MAKTSKSDPADEEAVIAIARGIKEYVGDAGERGVEYIKAQMHDLILETHPWNKALAIYLSENLLKMCFNEDIERYILALRQYQLDEGDQYVHSKNRLMMINASWELAERGLEAIEYKHYSIKLLKCACYAWQYATENSAGRAKSLVRRFVQQLCQKKDEVDHFAHTMETDSTTFPVQRFIFTCMLEFYTDNMALWNTVNIAYIGKVKGLNALVKAIELRSKIHLLDDMLLYELINGSNLIRNSVITQRNNLIEELYLQFLDKAEANNWLSEISAK